MVDKVLRHFDDAMGKITKRMDEFGARMDAIEGKRRRKDEEEEREERREHESEHERETAREVVAEAHADSITDFRVKAEKALQSIGLETSKPLIGESPRAYTERTLRSIKKFSKRFAKLDLGTLPDAAFAMVTDSILADCEEAGRSGAFVTGGVGIVEVKRPDGTGRPISHFYSSDGSTFIREMKRPARHVRAFSLPGMPPMMG